jgi:hypothetical protein
MPILHWAARAPVKRIIVIKMLAALLNGCGNFQTAHNRSTVVIRGRRKSYRSGRDNRRGIRNPARKPAVALRIIKPLEYRRFFEIIRLIIWTLIINDIVSEETRGEIWTLFVISRHRN